MGCGCRRNKNISVSTSSNSGQASSRTIERRVACIHKYDELTLLDRKAVALLNKFRNTEMKSRYLEIQRTLRKWTINLRVECPDETELKEYAEFINSEYSKHFNSVG